MGTSLRFVSQADRLHTETVHEFAPETDYSVTFALTDGSPVAPARDFRGWLRDHGGLGSLRDKIAQNPEVGKLVGAFHTQPRVPDAGQRPPVGIGAGQEELGRIRACWRA